MKAYDAGFREEVLAACDAHEGTRAVALRFKVSESWVRRIKQQRRETGTSRTQKGGPAQAQVACVGGLVTGKARRPTRHLSP